MAFEQVTLEAVTPAKERTGASAVLVKAGRSKKAGLRITLKPETAEACGFTDRDRFVLLLGTGDDHGVIRLRKDAKGAATLKERTAGHGSTYYQINLGHRPEFVNRSEKARDCNWETISLTEIEIVLPAWADETRPKKAVAMSALPPPARAAEKERQRLEAEKAEADARRAELETAEEKAAFADMTERLMTAATADFDSALKLTRSEKALLTILVDRADKLVTKETLALLLYQDRPDDPPNEKIVDVYICKIRPKLAGTGVSIVTEWGQGYRLEGDAAVLLRGRAA